ncbi:MAG: hypothetical protein MEQ84_11005 [Mesorhizobium sp.]|nr:hypothetical protein [Mesorhizobium sp.]
MRIKALLAAAAITAFTGSAIAQSTGATGGEPAEAQWGSAQEEQMFQENRETWGGFFMDENFTEMAPEADMRANWDAMSAEDQDEARAVCEQVSGAPTEYRNVTVQWCENIGQL